MSLLKALRCRRATSSDYNRVIAINDNVYTGVDYLPVFYHLYLSDPRRFLYVGEIDQKIVSQKINNSRLYERH